MSVNVKNKHGVIPFEAYCVAVCFLLFFSGCGGSSGSPDLVVIEGVVTLDGEPLPDAEVQFHPGSGRPSVGRTDSLGRYWLEYLPGTKGAVPGTHRVVITTFVQADPDSLNPIEKEGAPERVPAKYNRKSTLSVDVQPGTSSVQNFTLESVGDKGKRS